MGPASPKIGRFREGMMTGRYVALLRATAALCCTAVLGAFAANSAMAGTIEVFHADSLAGPMRELKKAFEAKNAGVTVNLTSGVSKKLAERILAGDSCDVFAPSSPAVIDQDLMGKKLAGLGQEAASWYVIFSANEMVVITAKGNPLGIRQVSDLAKSGVKLARVTGEKDLATGRTIEFLKRAAAAEGKAELAQGILDAAPVDPAKPVTVPDTVRAVKEGAANAGVVYYSAAVAARDDIDIIRFPASVNMSEAIRNAATVPGTAKSPKEGTDFVRFLLSGEARGILLQTGQPPVAPAVRKGSVPAAVDN
jgi:molybdate transport system substrate-binding protein